MMKYSCLVVAIFCCINFSFSQKNEFSNNEIVLDLGGIGGFGALSFQKKMFEINQVQISGKLGISFFRFKDFTQTFNPDILVPFSINLNRQFNKFGFQIGIGQTVSSIVTVSSNFQSKERENTVSGSLMLGMKFDNPQKRMTYSIFYSPIFQQYNRYRHWGGMSIGFKLKNKKQ